MIKTDRLELDMLKMEFAEELFLIWTDWEVVKYTYIRNIKTLDDCKKRIDNILRTWNNPKNIGPYVVKCNSKVIGFAGGVHKSEELGEYEIFYHFDKASWGKGYATETAKEILQQAFLRDDTQRVMAEAVTDNQSSWKVLEKIGMMKEGVLRRKFFNGSEFKDLYVYSVLRSDLKLQGI